VKTGLQANNPRFFGGSGQGGGGCSRIHGRDHRHENSFPVRIAMKFRRKTLGAVSAGADEVVCAEAGEIEGVDAVVAKWDFGSLPRWALVETVGTGITIVRLSWARPVCQQAGAHAPGGFARIMGIDAHRAPLQGGVR